MSLYYQYGVGGPSAMQTPDYQTFLKLLEAMRQQNGGDGSKSSQGQGQGGGGMGGLGSLFKMFGGAPSGGGPSGGDMAGSAGGMFDSPVGGMGGGMAGLFA